MDLRERRELNKGFGDGLSRAFELVLTPLVVAFVGFWLDRRFGLLPVLTVVFALWGVVVTTYLAWVRYDAEMREQEGRRGAIPPSRPVARRWQSADADLEPAVPEAAVADV